MDFDSFVSVIYAYKRLDLPMLPHEPLKSNHRKIYDFLKNYELFHRVLSSKSPKPLRAWRIMAFILAICFFAVLVITFSLKAWIWYVISIIAFLADMIAIVWLHKRAMKFTLTGFHSFSFKKMLELEEYVKSELKLSKKEVETTAAICFNLAERNKRNYYRLELPLTFIGLAVTIFAVVKDISLREITSLAILFAFLVFGLWHMLANIVTTLDLRSKRYLEAYELLVDIENNKQYKKLKKERLEALKEEQVEIAGSDE